MATLQNRFHELANWHQKIIFSTIMTREILLDKNLTHLPDFQLREIISRSIKILSKVDQYVVSADKIIEETKSFLYKKVSPDVEIPSENK